ncbi:hypothetical protein TSUD_312420 [Trifolium subterraneum]|uniref:Uncharacterized protein n=1 Tax=Trifolium subterraneum TaxID=3900 RepID=A0A2Z6MU64_TRISU|nr:hypothetical protein TSUD_312420 [Trifolium subterraneum]
MEETSSILSSNQRYATAALFSFALHRSQFHQGRPPASPHGGDGGAPETANTSSVSDNAKPPVNDNSALLFPVFRYSIKLMMHES